MTGLKEPSVCIIYYQELQVSHLEHMLVQSLLNGVS